MGLDGVELVMAAEEAFGVTLTESETWEVKTARMLGDLIFSKLQSTDQSVCQSQRAFHLLRKAFMRHFNLPRSAVTLDMPFKKLIRRSQEKEIWVDLKRAVYARSWPECERPLWLRWTLVLLTLATPFAVWRYLHRALGADVAALIGLVAMLAIGMVAARATRRFKTRIPAGITRVRDIIPFAVTSDQVKWTRDQVSDVVQKLVIEQLGIPEAKYREDADFIKDLGMN